MRIAVQLQSRKEKNRVYKNEKRKFRQKEKRGRGQSKLGVASEGPDDA